MFTKSIHQITFRKLLAKHHIQTAGKSFEEALIKLLESQQTQIETIEAKVKKTR